MVLNLIPAGIIVLLAGLVVDSFTTRLLSGDNPQTPNAVREASAELLILGGVGLIVFGVLW